MFNEKADLRVLMIGIVIACLSFLIFSNPDNGGSLILCEIMNCGHFPLFGVIALALFYYFELGQARGGKNYYLAWSVTIGLGLLTEFIQFFQPDRLFELRDLAYDALGAFTFLTFSYSFRLSDQPKQRTIRVGVVLICLAATIPIWMAVAEWREMRRNFPLISSFETQRDINRWGVHGAVLIQTREHATLGSYSAKITLSPGEYPGLSSDYFIRDWRSYHTLACDIFLTGDTPLRLTFRINDKAHNQAFIDRYNRAFILQPGANRIRIPLADVVQSPRGRCMDMRAIALICIFAYRLDTPRTFFIDNILLL